MERQLRVEFIKSTADPTRDPQGTIIAEIEARVTEIEEMMLLRNKRYDRLPGELGYDLSVRKAAAVKTLVDQGWARSEAKASVEDIVEKGMLPDPPLNGTRSGRASAAKYSLPVRESAAIKTLVDLEWKQSDAKVAVGEMAEGGTLPDPFVDLSNANPSEVRNSEPVAASNLSLNEIWSAFEKVDSKHETNEKQTSVQRSTIYAQESSELHALESALIGLRISWYGWVDDVQIEMDPPGARSSRFSRSSGTWQRPRFMSGPELTFVVGENTAMRLEKDLRIKIEGTISSVMEVGKRPWNIKLADVSCDTN